jgi:hypothetical protein
MIKAKYLVLIWILISGFALYYHYNNNNRHLKLEQFYQESTYTPSPTYDPNIAKILIMNPMPMGDGFKRNDNAPKFEKSSMCDPQNPKLCIYNFNAPH